MRSTNTHPFPAWALIFPLLAAPRLASPSARPLSSLAFAIIGMTLSLTSLSSIFISPPSARASRPSLLPAPLLFPSLAFLPQVTPLNIFLPLLPRAMDYFYFPSSPSSSSSLPPLQPPHLSVLHVYSLTVMRGLVLMVNCELFQLYKLCMIFKGTQLSLFTVQFQHFSFYNVLQGFIAKFAFHIISKPLYLDSFIFLSSYFCYFLCFTLVRIQGHVSFHLLPSSCFSSKLCHYFCTSSSFNVFSLQSHSPLHHVFTKPLEVKLQSPFSFYISSPSLCRPGEFIPLCHQSPVLRLSFVTRQSSSFSFASSIFQRPSHALLPLWVHSTTSHLAWLDYSFPPSFLPSRVLVASSFPSSALLQASVFFPSEINKSSGITRGVAVLRGETFINPGHQSREAAEASCSCPADDASRRFFAWPRTVLLGVLSRGGGVKCVLVLCVIYSFLSLLISLFTYSLFPYLFTIFFCYKRIFMSFLCYFTCSILLSITHLIIVFSI